MKRVAWNKGLTKETDKRVKKNADSGKDKKRLSHLGKKHTEETKKKISLSNKNQQKSEEHKKKISITLKRKFKENKIIPYWLGKKHSQETKLKISQTKKELGSHKLERNAKWKGGISKEAYGIEFTEELKERVRNRDKRTCQICFKPETEKRLDVHHINENKRDNNMKNLISLHHYCHIILHNKRLKFKNVVDRS
ncbi:MAG: HNH endonuclease [Nanoarchaeota archaeon]|nr:HNH endonuclease [Nanoarchaeota archaeon]